GAMPHLLCVAYQGTFAIITAALISGAIVERMRFGPYIAFITAWSLLVYAPIAHWVWGGGWLSKLGALDFAGGTVVHVNAAAAALVCAIVIGSRKDYARQAILPQNVPFTLLGAGLLWLGWFGFNAGSALAANKIAALAFANTMLAPTTRLDDSLDVVAAHGVGGIVGALFTGIFARTHWNPDGGNGGFHQLGIQAIAVLATMIYSAVATLVILKVLALIAPLRTAPREE